LSGFGTGKGGTELTAGNRSTRVGVFGKQPIMRTNHLNRLTKNTRALLYIALYYNLTVVCHATTIQFEPGPPPPIVGRSIPVWIEQGYSFMPTGDISHYNAGSGITPFNGTPFIKIAPYAPPNVLTVNNLSGASFAALSVDLAEYSTVFATPRTINFVGLRLDSSTVSVGFQLDGVVDGAGGLPDFQRFFFPPSFADLVSLKVVTDTYAMDNLVVQVPEPSVISLFALGLGSSVILASPRARSRGVYQQSS
jgi:hypothetical protein